VRATLPLLLALLLAAALVVAACEQKSETPAKDPAPVKARFPYPNDPKMQKPAPDVFKVRFVTSEGDFVIEAHRQWAPIGVDRFYNLVRHGFYDDTRIFRVKLDFVVQFGISGDPEVSLDWYEAAIRDEAVRQKNLPGTVSFAKTKSPHSRTTQLFVNLKDNSALDMKGFSPIGRVVEGMAVFAKLSSTMPDDDPMGLGRTPDADKIKGLGNKYLDMTFPHLCRIKSAKVEK